MTGEQNLTELFDRYFEGDLTQSERQEFDNLLATDPVLAAKFKLFQNIDRAIKEEDIMRLRQQIRDIQVKNLDILEAGPMQIARFTNSQEQAAELDQDIANLRTKLDHIHDRVGTTDNQEESSEYGVYLEVRESLADEKESGTQLDLEIETAILEEDIMILRSKLDEISKQVIPTKTVQPRFRRYIAYVSASAAVLVLLVAGALILNFSKNSFDSSSYVGLFKPYEGVSVTRGPAEEEDKIRTTAIELYNQGEFLQAGNLLDVIIKNGETSKLIRVYAGACALQNGKPDKGINYLSGWDETEPTYFDAQWYLAGCYLLKDEWEKALAILERLVNDDNFKNYPYPAGKLIKKLQKNY